MTWYAEKKTPRGGRDSLYDDAIVWRERAYDGKRWW